MRRREFVTFFGVAIAWPFAADAQKTAIPVIGYISSRSAETEAALRTPFLKRLADAGFVVGQNVLVEYRFAEGKYDQLKGLAADLVRRQISVLVATDRSPRGRRKQQLRRSRSFSRPAKIQSALGWSKVCAIQVVMPQASMYSRAIWVLSGSVLLATYLRSPA